MSRDEVSGIFQRWEPPDTVCVDYVGVLNPAHVHAAQVEAAPWTSSVPYFFVLINVAKLGPVSKEVRKAFAENGESAKQLRGIAIVGASFHLRAVGNMITKAAAILHRHVDNPLRFFETEEEARAWLVERRREVRRRLESAT